MNSIDARIAALAEAIERRKMEQDTPVDDLSKSLYELGRELAGLDALGKSALLKELNTPSEGGTAGLDLTLEELEKMIVNFTD